MLTLVALRAFVARIPGIVWVALFAILLLVGAGYSLFRKGEASAVRRVTQAARKDSLVAIVKAEAPILRADSQATVQRVVTGAAVQHQRDVRRELDERLQRIQDTMKVVPAAPSADPLLELPVPLLVEKIHAEHGQVVADSVDMIADSVKIATLEARQPYDSARVTLATRIEDGPSTDAGGHSIPVKVILGTVAAVLVVVHFVK